MPHPIIWLRKTFGKTFKAAKCGHKTKRTGIISAFGETRVIQMPKNEDGSVSFCLKCLGKMTILCAWCGEPIFIGEPVTLYTPKKADFQVPEHAVVYNQDPLRLVGCLGWNCATAGIDRAGFWIPCDDGKGCVHRIQSSLEAVLATETPSIVVVDDLTDMGKEGRPKLISTEESEKSPE